MQEDKQSRRILMGTKWILGGLFFLGIVVTATVPLSLWRLGKWMPGVRRDYGLLVVMYLCLGTMSVLLLQELRKIFRTVLCEDCFVRQNVASLRRMSILSFLIAAVSLGRLILCATIANAILIFVFVIAGLFSRVLSAVFAEAVSYKEENDLTI